MKTLTSLLMSACFLSLTISDQVSAQLHALQLLHEDTFDAGIADWQMTDASAWRVQADRGNNVLKLYRNSNFTPPFRSPLNIALLKDVIVGDFTFTARVRSTVEPYDHQDVSVFFGYQNPSQFYYAHLGKLTDDRANQIFVVNNADRTKISSFTTAGTPWDRQWHDVKVERTIEDGSISVFFDDMKTPVMRATDYSFTWGQVGIGSFDDPADWDDVRLFVSIPEPSNAVAVPAAGLIFVWGRRRRSESHSPSASDVGDE